MKRLFDEKYGEAEEGGYVLLARFPELWQADLAVSLLASEGIRACAADDLLINGTDHWTDMDGTGVVVHEADAMAAWNILQMAERGELSLPEDHTGHPEDVRVSSKKVAKDLKPESLYGETMARFRTPAPGEGTVVRCPRCGSENTEKRRGIRALLNPGHRCKVCRWEWKRKKQY